MEKLKFTKEELKQMQKSLDIILDDLEQLWENSTKTEIKILFNKENDNWSSFTDMEFCMNQVGIGIRDNYDSWMVIEKFSTIKNRKKLKNLDENKIFYFLQNYDFIREKINVNIRSNTTMKKEGLKRIIELGKKYDKQASIKIEVPESENSSSLILTEENSQTIGKIKMGFGNIKIITKGNISLV